MSKLQENTTALREVLDILKNKAEGGSPTLIGSFVWETNPDFTPPSEYISIDFPEGTAYTYFYDGSEYHYSRIEYIQFGDDGIIDIHASEENGNALTEFDGAQWFSIYQGEVFDFPDYTYRVIDIKNPISLPIEQYNLFMDSFNNVDDETCYTIGHTVGYNEGQKSANYELYGTYIFSKTPTYAGRTTALTLDVSSGDIWAHFYYEGFSENMYQWVNKIIFGTYYFQVVTFGDHDEPVVIEYSLDDGWVSMVDNDIFPIEGNYYRVIDFKEPLGVPKEVYDLFMGMVENPDTTPYNIGYDGGKKAEHDKFWDAFQNNGDRVSYIYAFYQWGDDAFYPKYDMTPVNASAMFNQLKAKNFKQRLIDCGVTLDLSQATAITDIFGVSTVTHVPVINTTSAKNLNSIFYNCGIVDIEKLILKSDGSQTLSDSFKWCESLQNIVIEGTIGYNGVNFQWSTKLSKNSIYSVINHLSTTTSGLSITLSLTAVQKAFETGLNYNDGATSQEFLALRNSRSNWTINMV